MCGDEESAAAEYIDESFMSSESVDEFFDRVFLSDAREDDYLYAVLIAMLNSLFEKHGYKIVKGDAECK